MLGARNSMYTNKHTHLWSLNSIKQSYHSDVTGRSALGPQALTVQSGMLHSGGANAVFGTPLVLLCLLIRP